jgi:hypothetical protein
MRVDRDQDKGSLVLEKRDCQPLVEDKVDEKAEKSRHTFLDNMDAIACGVKAWFEENTGYSRRLAETTVDIARALGVPESDINRWESSRAICDDKEKVSVIKSLLERLQPRSIQPYDNGNTWRKRYEVNLL